MSSSGQSTLTRTGIFAEHVRTTRTAWQLLLLRPCGEQLVASLHFLANGAKPRCVSCRHSERICSR
eukprot:6894341-Prorocentrum_lima.AAC.1